MSRLQTVLGRGRQFDPRSVPGLAVWLDAADAATLYTTDAGPVTAVSSPTEIGGCVGWWDASDAGSITQSGGFVSQWDDKSGNGNHATASGTARPTTGVRVIGGRNALDFDGVATIMRADGVASVVSGVDKPATVFVVVDRDSPQTNSAVAGWFSTTSPAPLLHFRYNGANWVTAKRDDTVSSKTTSSTTAVSADAIVCANVIFGTQSTIYENGTMSQPPGDIDVGATTVNAFAIGSANVLTSFFDGAFAEVIIFNAALSATDRARVEAYLAAKWGIANVHAPATTASQPVGYWGDKSGNGRNATQGTAASRPTVSATALNGRRQLGLVSQHLRGPSSTWSGSASIYWVGRTAQASAGAFVFSDGTTGQSDAFHAGWPNTQGVGAYGNGWQSGNAPRAESPSAWRNADVVAGVTLSSTEAIARVNGATTNTTAALTGSLSQSAAAQFSIGQDTPGGWTNLNGTLSELLIYQPALTAAQRQGLERYLAAKWGITLAPQVANADAQDWVNRVYANGGTVSSSTASAVNTLCESITSAGIRDRFIRMGIFAGSNLAAALVPLYRGQAFGGTTYGNATDTNFNFVSGDYAETGSSGGLTGTGNNGVGVGNTKHLRTGLQQSALATSNLHLSAFVFGLNGTGPTQSGFVGIRETATPQNRWWLEYRGGINTELGGNGLGFGAIAVQTGNKLISCSRESNTLLRAYVDGAQHGADITTDISSSLANRARDWYVFANNLDGGPNSYSPFRMGMYSIGLPMTGSQMSAFHAAVSAFNSAMNRT